MAVLPAPLGLALDGSGVLNPGADAVMGNPLKMSRAAPLGREDTSNAAPQFVRTSLDGAGFEARLAPPGREGAALA